MNNDSKTPDIPPSQNTQASHPHDPPTTVSAEERREIITLRGKGYGMRRIAQCLGRDRKTIRRVLEDEALLDLPHRSTPKGSSKLDPFREIIQKKVRKRLTVTRILREIRELGYTGGRSILSDYVRSLPVSRAKQKRVKRRFETRIGLEMQVDWTLYTVPIAQVPTKVHGLACMLAYSRKLHVHFYRDERQPTLLEGLTKAFDAFQGVSLRVVFDNMSTVVLGRIGRGRKPIWHPRLQDFARYYGFEAFACRVRDPDRKGKDERVLDYLEKDFIRGSEFESLQELNERVHHWTDHIANRRIHGTTRQVPDEAWLMERDFLIRLPEQRFPVYEQRTQRVNIDATLSVGGTLYTVPSGLAPQPVTVRLYAEHFEVLDRNDTLAFSRLYVEPRDKGKLQIDPAHYADLPAPAPDCPSGRIDEVLLKRFPQLAGLVEGIQLRMKSLAHIHLRALWRLAATYGDQAFVPAASRAQEYRRFNAQAVRRILERDHPLPELPLPLTPTGTSARVLAMLTDVEAPSLSDYDSLDKEETESTQTQDAHHEPKEDDHET